MDLARRIQKLWRPRELYESLDPGNQQIRLLHILPGRYDATVRCELTKVSLVDEPFFDAISYCWGDPSDTTELHVNGRLLSVTTSLYGALRRLRNGSERRTVWADALCINQTDIEERTQQVKLMHLIYSKASEVMIWLGESDTLTHTAIEALKEVVSTGEDPHIPALDPAATPAFPGFVSAMVSLLSRPWFRRLWVLQECQLAQTSTVFLCGQEEAVTASRLKIMVTAIYNMDRQLKSTLFSPSDQDAFEKLLTHIPQTFFTIAGIMRSASATNILEIASKLDCTDPRDKVFGILGLAPWLRSLDMDYDSPPFAIYMSATLATILHEGSLDILAASTARISVTAPSTWMLDLMSNSHAALSWTPRSGGDIAFAASASVPMEAEQVSIFLRLRGLQIDEVIDIGPQWALDSTGNETLLSPAPRSVAELLSSDRLAVWSDYLQTTPAAFWRVVLCDVIGEQIAQDDRDARSRRMDPHGFSLLQRRRLTTDDHTLLSQLLSHQHAPPMDAAYDERSKRLIESRIEKPRPRSKPFKTKSGLIGVSSVRVQPGDIIYALAGSTFPYLLRPRSWDEGGISRPPEAKDAKLYALVSPCFVYGVMDGEAVEQAKGAASSEDVHDEDVFQYLYIL